MGFEIERGVLKRYIDEPGVTDVIIPENVKKISRYAFYGCTEIINVTIPESVLGVDDSAFYGCLSLRRITIFGCTVDSIAMNAHKNAAFSTIKSMLDRKAYNIKIDRNIKYMFISQVLFNTEQPEARAYIEKNFTDFVQFSIAREKVDELRQYERLGLFTRNNIGKYVVHTFKQNNNEITRCLLSIEDSLCSFKPEKIDKYMELAGKNDEIVAILLEYKPKQSNIEEAKKESDSNNLTAVEWKKFFKYEINDGEVTIVAYKGRDVNVIIPEIICKKPVVAIADMAFSPDNPNITKAVKEKLKQIKSVRIGDHIKKLGCALFKNCESLENVTFPSGYEIIESSFFEGCKALVNCNATDKVVIVKERAFCGCKALTSIVISDKATAIGERAFYGCESLASVVIPDNLTKIESCVFHSCKSLKSVNIPDTVTEIGGYAFYGCTSLTDITIPECVKEIGGAAFAGCTLLSSVNIPEGITEICEEVFVDCKSLKSITIPDSVIEIGLDAFYNCTSLVDIYISENVRKIEGQAFVGTLWLENYPSDFVIVGEKILYKYKGKKEYVVIPEKVEIIGNEAFYNCKSLTNVIIPNGVTEIGSYSFGECTSLVNVNIPNSVIKIGSAAFKNCRSLKNLIIPEGVTEIGCWAFENCRSLTDIIIPQSVTEIGWNAFQKCKMLF